MNATTSDIQDAIRTMAIVCEVIKEAGSIPSGILYARLMEKMDYPTYQAMIRQILRTGLVSQDKFHRLTWIG